jgi:hypothetical protein
MIKLDLGLLNRLRPGSSLQPDTAQTQSKQASAEKANASYSVNIVQNESKSFSLFHKTVKRSVNESIGYEPKPKENDIEQELEDQEERASLAASNILGFIEKRLRADIADGASKAQLESRLNAALEGFEKGYKEANQILDDLNLITPSLEDEIALTKEKVMAGLSEFTDEFIAEPSQIIMPDSVQQDLSNLAPVEGTQYAQVEAGEARDFSFSLTTRDGDQVRINASSISAYQAQQGQSSNRDNGYYAEYQSVSGYQESKFGFTVEGELDEDEIKAINDLLNNVNDLATDFYSGDMNAAFEKAMSLGYDNNEIANFALSLTQVKQVKVMQAYQPEQEILKPSVIAELKPIGKFAHELAKSLAVAKDMFSHPRELLSQLFQEFTVKSDVSDGDNGQPTFIEFAESLLDKLEQLEDE